MKTEQQYFETGKLIADYMDGMSQLKEQSFAIYEKFEVPADGFAEELRAANLHILTITEDWCGDAMVNNPIIRKVAEAAGAEMRTFLRDADTDLIDRYLTNGGRAIPMYVLLDESGEVVGKWGPRAPELQQLVMDMRAGLPDKEDTIFEQAQKAMYDKMRTQYAEDAKLWSYVYEDFKRTVLAIIA
ncbi:MAG: thioredoxin family protein [Solibacillus sp.]